MRAFAVRTGAERKADALARLRAGQAEVWVASASVSGVPHLVPLSLAWDGRRVILAVDRQSLTARNVIASGKARLALGETSDVVIDRRSPGGRCQPGGRAAGTSAGVR